MLAMWWCSADQTRRYPKRAPYANSAVSVMMFG